MASRFLVVLRGYPIAEVDQFFAQVDEALSSGTETMRATVRERLRNASFKSRLRGYSPAEVNRAVHERLRELS